MRKLILIMLSLFLFTSTGCSLISDEVDTPSLKVTYNKQSISVKKGSYQWSVKLGSYHLKDVSADSASPEQLTKNMDGNIVSPQGELQLNFSKKPNKIKVVDWSVQKDNSYTFDDNTIIVPKEKGTYIYEIIGYWDEGQVSYTIKVIVNN